ncbi:MAG: LamG domain-containing protein [Polyangiaceae bacterium]
MKAAAGLLLLSGCGPTYVDATGLAPTTLESGLVAHWAFDETAGEVVADDSGNRRDGSVVAAAFTNDGQFDGAMHFRPGDSVVVPNFPYASASWTLSAWIRIADDDVPSDDFGSVLGTEQPQQGGWQLQTRGRSLGIYWTFAYWLGSGNQYAHYECQCFQLGRWSHATVVVDSASNRLSFYVDGVLSESNRLPGPILPGTSDLLMGKWVGAGRPFSGSLDDVSIYDRALNAAEVAELHVRPPRT